MMGRMDLRKERCSACCGTGKSSKNRKRPCPECSGQGAIYVCKNYGGVYGKECVDTAFDQTFCGKDKP